MRTDLIRRQSGFDERFRIAADYKLILHCHLAGCRVCYRPGDADTFACFGMSGSSELNVSLMNREFAEVLADAFGLDPKKTEEYRARGYLPIWKVLRFLFSCDEALRGSARSMCRAWIAAILHGMGLYGIVEKTRALRYGHP